jgi:hypothetical protein
LEPVPATSLTSVAPVPASVPGPERLAGDQAADPVARARLDLTEPVRLPPEGRFSASTLAILAAAAGVVAILLGGWAFVSGTGDDDGSVPAAPTAPSGYEEALALLAAPNVERLPLQGSVGRIVLAVRPTGEAALVLNGLGEAENGWAYQAWVSTPGAITPHSAALFSGTESVVPLDTAVPPGAKLAVTLEPEDGSFAPTRTPKLVVERPKQG